MQRGTAWGKRRRSADGGVARPRAGHGRHAADRGAAWAKRLRGGANDGVARPRWDTGGGERRQHSALLCVYSSGLDACVALGGCAPFSTTTMHIVVKSPDWFKLGLVQIVLNCKTLTFFKIKAYQSLNLSYWTIWVLLIRESKETWFIGVFTTRPVICKPKVSMKSLCSTAASYCHTGQTKGRYHTRARFNPSRCCRGNPKNNIVEKNAEMKKILYIQRFQIWDKLENFLKVFIVFMPMCRPSPQRVAAVDIDAVSTAATFHVLTWLSQSIVDTAPIYLMHCMMGAQSR